MNYINHELELINLEESKGFKEVNDILLNCFALDKIIVNTKKKIGSTKKLGGNIFEVTAVHDSKYTSIEDLIDFGHRLLPNFDNFLNRMYSKGGDYHEIVLKAEYLLANLEIQIGIHEIKNRFSFSKKNPFVTIIDNKLSPIEYEFLKMNKIINNTLKEYYSVRVEIFQELKIRTSLYISKISIEQWRTTPLKLNPKTKQVIMCFFIALEKSAGLLKLNKNDADSILHAFRDLLGYSNKQFNSMKHNYNGTKNIEKHFRHAIESSY